MLRMRRAVKRKAGAVMLAAAAGVGLFIAGGVYAGGRSERTLKALLEEKTARMDAAGRMVYITTGEIKAGEYFTEENTELRFLLSEQSEEGLAQEVLGMVACGNIGPGVILSTALCGSSEVSETERECVLEDIRQAEAFSDYAVVDVRIRYPNGENYCVLKRKVLHRKEGEEGCRLFLEEREQLLLSAARYDAERYKGTELYAVSFREERIQEECGNDYIPAEQVIMQLQQAGGVGAASEWLMKRRALEERLRENEEQLKAG